MPLNPYLFCQRTHNLAVTIRKGEMSDDPVKPPSNLLCNVGFIPGLREDCSAMLVSDGENWRCPYNHFQYRDDTGLLRREIPDKRRSK